MGTCTDFYLGAEDGLKSIFLREAPDFAEWYGDLYCAEPESYTEVELNILRRIVAGDPSVWSAEDEANVRTLDKLIELFVTDYGVNGGYPDFPGKQLFAEASSVKNFHINLRRYPEAKDPTLKMLIDVASFGRSLVTGRIPNHWKQKLLVGYWTATEALILAPTIRSLYERLNDNDQYKEYAVEKTFQALEAIVEVLNKSEQNQTGVIIRTAG